MHLFDDVSMFRRHCEGVCKSVPCRVPGSTHQPVQVADNLRHIYYDTMGSFLWIFLFLGWLPDPEE